MHPVNVVVPDTLGLLLFTGTNFNGFENSRVLILAILQLLVLLIRKGAMNFNN